jgi:hypothetical protein
MIADTSIVLRAGPNQFLELSSVERFDDGSGYASRLSVGSLGLGRFTCTGHPFYFSNLDEFAKNIAKAYELVAGKARLAHIFEKDFIEVEVLRGGQVMVTGLVIECGPPQQEMRFAFGCDQTFLPDFLCSLQQVAKEIGNRVGEYYCWS